MKFRPTPWSIIIAILGVIGAFYFVSTVSDPWSFYEGPTCCEECAMLTAIAAASIIALIVGIFGMFEKDESYKQ